MAKLSEQDKSNNVKALLEKLSTQDLLLLEVGKEYTKEEIRGEIAIAKMKVNYKDYGKFLRN